MLMKLNGSPLQEGEPLYECQAQPLADELGNEPPTVLELSNVSIETLRNLGVTTTAATKNHLSLGLDYEQIEFTD